MRTIHHTIRASGRLVTVLVAATTLASCVPTQRAAGALDRGDRELQTSTYSNKSIIFASELGRATDRSLYDALRRLRPELLWRRHPSPLNPYGFYPALIVDGTPMGDALDTQTIPARQVREVRFVDRGEALLRYGAGSEGGAIVVLIGRR